MPLLRHRPLPVLLAAALAACAGDAPPPRAEAPPAAPAAPAGPPASAPWRANPAQARVEALGDTLVRVQTGPHTVLWPADAAELSPPYTVRATLRKGSGRIHEATGLVFGATGLERPEAEQGYTYFLTRGDGSFLIKERRGAATPVLVDWTTHPAIRRDAEDGGRANELEVRAGTDEVVFAVNGAEVARLPAAGLQLTGVAGVRASHDVELDVAGFRAGPGAPAAP